MGKRKDTITASESRRGIDVLERELAKEPRLFKVILLNDDYTTMEFVVFILQTIFRLPLPDAQKVMLNVHTQGSGVCGIYPLEIAETKVATVYMLARQSNFPLRCAVEPE